MDFKFTIIFELDNITKITLKAKNSNIRWNIVRFNYYKIDNIMIIKFKYKKKKYFLIDYLKKWFLIKKKKIIRELKISSKYINIISDN